MKCKRIFRSILPVMIYCLYIFLIFSNSMQTAGESSQRSMEIVKLINDSFFGGAEIISEHLVRKAAHFTEFAGLGVLGLLCFKKCLMGRGVRPAVASLFTGLLTALLDETIQLFVEGRSGQVTDVWIDFAGVCCGTALAVLLICFIAGRRKRKQA